MLSVLLPSRRPKDCKEAVESALSTAEDIEILVYVDDDDPHKSLYPNAIIGPPKRSGRAIRHLASLAKGDLMFFGSDDFRWKTKGWDRIFREKMPAHNLSVLYPNDMPGGAKGLSPCFSRRFMDETGLFPDVFEHFGPDTWVIAVSYTHLTLPTN